MAKISPISIKYMIYSKFLAEGTLEKPDVIGAVFGQTEGLLGTDLEMRDLQKEGKIGRIEVTLKTENGKTTGEILIPSALDKTETTLIAAAIETIERIGPSTAKISVEKIEDVRENKREYILERAKKLLENIEQKMPQTRDMSRTVKTESRADRIQEYGDDKLPAGNIDGNEVIVVEGRADVLNLLRNNVENVIGMDGTKLPETIKKLSREKEITLFIDGDRGGKLIAKNVIDNARVSFISFAPDGKEVEELSGKEILSSLRKKIPIDDYMKNSKRRSFKTEKKPEKEAEEKEEVEEGVELDNEKLEKLLKQVENTNSVLVLGKKLEVIDKVPVRGLYLSLSRVKDAYVLVVDKATPTVINSAEKANVKNVVAKNFAISKDTDINLISL